ncbi:hypothetical protein F4820DRAFT_441530 [Hypoxylon rubiginosum]|uniref:Uncharacterized protein n=1 Tax=Hypoxylon rubiginosum TaxID=110542 RepID=A0ACB9YHE7_9PEZI|nr:hypothetical protein F4820DRAFT_441530 [Hypoxylon rubiginosum]
MVLSTAAQPNSTYLVWKRFRYPDDKGTTDAIAVPKWVGDTLNPAYALIIDLALLNFWTVFFGIVLYFYLSKKRKKAAKLDPLVPKIWNKRSDLISLVIEAITSLSQTCPNPVVVLILLLCLAGWVGQKATGILVPPLILVNNAAPVDPAAIYVPTIPPNSDSARLANLFALEAPRFLRALGSTAAGAELRKKVDVSEGTLIGQTVNGSDILRIDYKYSATGADMGLQHYPDLTLNVVGSCVTEYGWYNNTATLRDNTGGASTLDYYNIWGNKTADLFKVSLYDGRQPSATFFLGTNSSQGTLAHSNATWAAAISSTDRVSFSPSTDPWYLTGPAIEGDTGARYAVMPGRPPLTCWQDDVWSYQDKNSTVEDLNTIIDISDDFRAILTSILSAPMIYLVGQHLASSALLSATTAIDQLFDAGSSSIHGDIERLVLAAYVATINVLTDTTLYPVGASEKLSNLARDGSAQPLNGIADFVVWSPDVAALSTVAIIVIPSVFVGLWILALILLYWTPARIVNKLDSIGTLATIDDAEPQPNQ